MRLAVMMLDGLELKGRMMIVALGDHDRGRQDPARALGRLTENATVATALLADLVERGLDPEQGMLFVLDGSKALRKADRSVFGEVPVQRCVRHYADPAFMPTRIADAFGGGRMGSDLVGIITARRGMRGCGRGAGSGRVSCRAGLSGRALSA